MHDGPAPKPASKRRRRNKPASYGLAQPITAPAASDDVRTLGIDNPHELVTAMWQTVQTSCESRFFSPADWARVRLELYFANAALTGEVALTAAHWQQVQRGLNDLLISPAEKRRCAIEVRPSGPDADENAAVAMIGRYRSN
jgi:hypothetical protein